MICPECGHELELMIDGEWVCMECGYYCYEEYEEGD